MDDSVCRMITNLRRASENKQTNKIDDRSQARKAVFSVADMCFMIVYL